MTLNIKIDLDKKCKKCGKGGATQSGYCLKCVAKMIKNGRLDHIIKPIKNAAKKALNPSNQ